MSGAPTHGMLAIHGGGGPRPWVRKDCNTEGLRWAASINTLIATASGTTSTTSTTSVMITAATERRPPTTCCSRTSVGHVATAMVVAQTRALRNGSSVHALPTIKMAMTRTNRTMRVMSGDFSDCIASSG